MNMRSLDWNERSFLDLLFRSIPIEYKALQRPKSSLSRFQVG